MIAEGIDTAITVARALAGWIVFAGVVAAVLVVAAAVTGAWAVRGTWRWVYARLTASPARRALPEGPTPHRPSRARSALRRRPVPSWAHTQPHTYEEAA